MMFKRICRGALLLVVVLQLQDNNCRQPGPNLVEGSGRQYSRAAKCFVDAAQDVAPPPQPKKKVHHRQRLNDAKESKNKRKEERQQRRADQEARRQHRTNNVHMNRANMESTRQDIQHGEL